LHSCSDQRVEHTNDDIFIEERSGLGRVLVASRDFEVGECVFQENPVLVWRAYYRESFLEQFKAASDQTKAAIMDMYHPSLAHSVKFPIVRRSLDTAALYFRTECSLSVPEIAKLFLICDINCHEYLGNFSEYGLHNPFSPSLQKAALFFKISKAAHSCDPNCVNTSKWGDGCMRLMASKRIKKGEVITHSYMYCDNVPAAERRAFLKETKCFDCMCERCVAPDYCRGLRCIQDGCTGVTIRVDGDQGPWICSKCNASTSDHDLQPVISNEKWIAQKFEAMQRSVQYGYGDVSPAQIQKFMEDTRKLLSPSHYLCVNMHDFLAKIAISRHQVRPCNQLLETSALAGLHAVHLVECNMSRCTNSTSSCCHTPCPSRVANVLWALHDLVQFDRAKACAVARRYAGTMRLMYGPEDKDVVLFESMAAGS
jgi:hypothetical protein